MFYVKKMIFFQSTLYRNTVDLHGFFVSVWKKHYLIKVSTMTENTKLYVKMIQVFITNVSISVVSFKEVCHVQVLE